MTMTTMNLDNGANILVEHKKTFKSDQSQKAICLDVQLKRPGNRKSIGAGSIEAGDTDKKMLSVAKKLLNSEEREKIEKLDQEIRKYLYNTSIPFHLKNGIYMIPVKILTQVEGKLKLYREVREQLIQAFLEAYPKALSEAKEALGGLFDARDYLPVPEMARRFSMTWRYFTFDTPESLSEISAELWEEEREKAAKNWEAAQEEIRVALRASMADLVNHMVDKLSEPEEEGKKKIFRNTMVSNFNDFLELFAPKNITNDTELENLVEQARMLMQGVEPDDIRKNADVKTMLRDGMSDIKKQLDEMLVDAPTRFLQFEED